MNDLTHFLPNTAPSNSGPPTYSYRSPIASDRSLLLGAGGRALHPPAEPVSTVASLVVQPPPSHYLYTYIRVLQLYADLLAVLLAASSVAEPNGVAEVAAAAAICINKSCR